MMKRLFLFWRRPSSRSPSPSSLPESVPLLDDSDNQVAVLRLRSDGAYEVRNNRGGPPALAKPSLEGLQAQLDDVRRSAHRAEVAVSQLRKELREATGDQSTGRVPTFRGPAALLQPGQPVPRSVWEPYLSAQDSKQPALPG